MNKTKDKLPKGRVMWADPLWNTDPNWKKAGSTWMDFKQPKRCASSPVSVIPHVTPDGKPDRKAAQAAVKWHNLSRDEKVERLARGFPTNWCDEMLTGPNASLKGKSGTWGCPDIEGLISSIRARVVDSILAEMEGRA